MPTLFVLYVVVVPFILATGFVAVLSDAYKVRARARTHTHTRSRTRTRARVRCVLHAAYRPACRVPARCALDAPVAERAPSQCRLLRGAAVRVAGDAKVASVATVGSRLANRKPGDVRACVHACLSVCARVRARERHARARVRPQCAIHSVRMRARVRVRACECTVCAWPAGQRRVARRAAPRVPQAAAEGARGPRGARGAHRHRPADVICRGTKLHYAWPATSAVQRRHRRSHGGIHARMHARAHAHILRDRARTLAHPRSLRLGAGGGDAAGRRGGSAA